MDRHSTFSSEKGRRWTGKPGTKVAEKVLRTGPGSTLKKEFDTSFGWWKTPDAERRRGRTGGLERLPGGRATSR
jgi:hypothetical protein